MKAHPSLFAPPLHKKEGNSDDALRSWCRAECENSRMQKTKVVTQLVRRDERASAPIPRVAAARVGQARVVATANAREAAPSATVAVDFVARRVIGERGDVILACIERGVKLKSRVASSEATERSRKVNWLASMPCWL